MTDPNKLLENWEKEKEWLEYWVKNPMKSEDFQPDAQVIPYAVFLDALKIQEAKTRAESNLQAFEILGEKALKTKSFEALNLFEEAQQQILDLNK